MKKYIRIFLTIAIITLAGIALYFYLGFFGNPISKLLCKNTAEKYVAENYPHCYVNSRGYNFKDGNYFANIQCETSPDTNFFIYTDWLGNFRRDSYESYVASGHNTQNRMMMEYRDLLDKAMPQEEVDFGIDIYYGDILSQGSYERYFSEKYPDKLHYMPQEEIILDKQYNFTDVSYKYGYVCLYAMDEDVSVERACEILLTVKQQLDEDNIGFYYIDFVLEKPRKTDGMPNDDETRINIDHFRWDDIYEDGLAERVQNAHDELTAYYEKMDAEKQKLFDSMNNQ